MKTALTISEVKVLIFSSKLVVIFQTSSAELLLCVVLTFPDSTAAFSASSRRTERAFFSLARTHKNA